MDVIQRFSLLISIYFCEFKVDLSILEKHAYVVIGFYCLLRIRLYTISDKFQVYPSKLVVFTNCMTIVSMSLLLIDRTIKAFTNE